MPFPQRSEQKPSKSANRSLVILHLALGGCLKAPPVDYGITEDTGGHIAYVIGAALAQAALDGVDQVSIVTRRFSDSRLSPSHALVHERINAKLTIDRLSTSNSRYLEKNDLAAEASELRAAFLAHLRTLPRLPDIIHAHFADAAGLALEARLELGVPFVYTPHSLALDKRKLGLPDRAFERRVEAERSALRSANLVIASSADECINQIGAYLSSNQTNGVALVRPGIPTHAEVVSTTIEHKLAEWLSAPSKPIVLAIARPVRKKNLIGLLRAYAGCDALQQSANLIILAGQRDGPGSDEDVGIVGELEALVAEHRLAEQVALPPRHSPGDVAGLYQRAARGGVFVNCALHEPFGLTLIEAAAAGAPVVTTAHGGPKEIVANLGHGILVDPLDGDAIAAACLEIVKDSSLHRRLSQSGLDNAHLYSWTRYADESVARYRTARTPRLIVCDIDATLTGCPIGAEAFRRWRADSDLGFVVATGRSLAAAVDVLQAWKLPQPDAFIVDVGTRIVLGDAAKGWATFTPYSDAIARSWSRLSVERAVASLGVLPQPRSTRGPFKTSYFGTAADAEAIRKHLETAGLAARVIFSHGNLIDVIPRGAGKAAAIENYASSLGLGLSQCVAAGDSGNDFDMMEQCGLAIIVSNATRELDDVAPRHGLYRASKPHAAGVMEGLAAFGLAA